MALALPGYLRSVYFLCKPFWEYNSNLLLALNYLSGQTAVLETTIQWFSKTRLLALTSELVNVSQRLKNSEIKVHLSRANTNLGVLFLKLASLYYYVDRVFCFIMGCGGKMFQDCAVYRGLCVNRNLGLFWEWSQTKPSTEKQSRRVNRTHVLRKFNSWPQPWTLFYL